jgi:hypothetical protein
MEFLSSTESSISWAKSNVTCTSDNNFQHKKFPMFVCAVIMFTCEGTCHVSVIHNQRMSFSWPQATFSSMVLVNLFVFYCFLPFLPSLFNLPTMPFQYLYVCARDLCVHVRSAHMRNWVEITIACCVGLFGSWEAFSHCRPCGVQVCGICSISHDTLFNFTNEVVLLDLWNLYYLCF